MPSDDDPQDLVRVYATGSASDGHLAKGRLESEGIPVMAKGEIDGPYRAGTMYLFVPSAFEERAKAVLAPVGDVVDDDVEGGKGP
jgi:hypothetical protein